MGDTRQGRIVGYTHEQRQQSDGMGLIAEYEIDCDGLPLVTVAGAVPEATVALDLQYTHGERPLFLATVTDGSPTAVEAAFADAADVQEWTLVGEAGATRRYQLRPALGLDEQLGEHVDDLAGLEALAGAEAIIERIEVRSEGWRQTGWFANRDVFETFASFWQRHGRFRVCRLTRAGEPESPGAGLSDPQYEALRIAYERGYFAIPRQVSLDDIAAELDISASAASERLRRAQTQLIQETVATTWPPLPD